MSKQSEAKERQQYTPKLIPGVCGNCVHYMCKKTKRKSGFSWDDKVYVDESNRRCGIGGFAIRKSGSCSEHAFDDSAAATQAKS